MAAVPNASATLPVFVIDTGRMVEEASRCDPKATLVGSTTSARKFEDDWYRISPNRAGADGSSQWFSYVAANDAIVVPPPPSLSSIRWSLPLAVLHPRPSP